MFFLTEEELSDKEDDIKQHIYDLVKSVNDVFNKIKNTEIFALS